MSTHVDVQKTAIETLIEGLGELQRRMDPASGFNYCAASDVPNFTLNGSFSQQLENARTAARVGQWLEAAEAARVAVQVLHDEITAAATAEGSADLVETYYLRVLYPILLWAAKKTNSKFYTALLVLFWLDQRGREWLSGNTFPDRMGFVVANILARTLFQVTRNDSEGNPLDPEFEWPLLAADLLGMGALGYNLKNPHRPYFDYWFGYGFDAPDPAHLTVSELAASRSVSLWLEDHPEARIVESSYQLTAPLNAAPKRLGVTFIPLLKPEHGTNAILPIPHFGFTDKVRLGDWDLELKRAETTGATGNIEATFSRVRGGDWFSLGNSSKKGPNAFLAVKNVEVSGKANYNLDDLSRSEASGAIRFKKIRFSIGNPGGSKLLERALPEGLSGEFDLGVVADARAESVHFEGGLGLDVYAPLQWNIVNKGNIGIEIPHVRLRLKAEEKQSGTKFAAAASLALALRLGPIKLMTDGLGVSWSMSRKAENDGNMGPFENEFDILKPTSFGLTVDSAYVTGGGFLSRDEENSRWFGALNLEFAEWTLSGVVMTEQSSLMAAVWATKLGISTPLGALDGLGLIVATDRRAERQAFLDGLKNGVLDSILFPADPVGNAPVILAAMRSLMPAAEGFHVFGVMVQWVFGNAAARLVVAEVAVLLEFESTSLRRIYLLGQGKVRLARLPEKLFSLNIEMFGVIDFEKKEFLLKLSLRNSKIAGGDLTGDGLVYIGEKGGILSLGGFNPRFTPPPGLPPVARLTANLVNTERVKLIFTAYVALTTSSFQIGGSVYVWAGAYGFSIEGYLKADLLARFDGEFFLDVQFGVMIRRGDRVLASIHFEGTFSGVSTWRLAGKAKFSILFLSVTIPVSFELGGSGPAVFETVDAVSAMKQALEAPESWSATQRNMSFSLRAIPRTGVWIAGDQSLRVSQTAVPFRQLITRMGASPLAAPREFAVNIVVLAGSTRTFQPVEDDFAPGLYQDVDLEEAVRAPQFERMQSGIEIDGQGVKLGGAVDIATAFEEQVLDEAVAPAPLPQEAVQVIQALDSTAVSQKDYYRVVAEPVSVQPRRYLVTYDTLELPPDLDPSVKQKGWNYTQAREYKRKRTAGLQVVRRYEVNAL